VAGVVVKLLPTLFRNYGILLCALLLCGCAGLRPYEETPRVSLVSIQPLEMQMLEQRFALQLRIMNPNDVEIPVSGLSYALEINQREFAYGVSQQAVNIPPYGEALLQVEVVSNLLNVMRQLQQMGDATGDGGLQYRLHGKIGLAGLRSGMPFDYAGKLLYRDPDAPAAPGD
jgi:LEA14-like dessication related protein